MPDTQPDHSGSTGSVANAWGNALARTWAPQLPRPLLGGFHKLLLTLRTVASANGELRYPDRKGIPIKEIAAAARSDLKDVRAWLAGGIAAGILAAQRATGRATIYRLVIHPAPNWTAAIAVISQHQQPRKDRRTATTEPAPWHEQPATSEPDEPREHPTQQPEPSPAPATPTQGDGPPTPTRTQTPGDHPPTPALPTQGDHPPTGGGGRSPWHLGGPPPSQPCNYQELHQERVAVVPQPADARARAQDTPPATTNPEPDPPSPTLHPAPEPQLGSRARRARRHVPDRQPPLLLAVPGTEHPAGDAAIAELRAAAADDPSRVRDAVRQLGHREALRLYGRRLVWAHALDLTTQHERTS